MKIVKSIFKWCKRYISLTFVLVMAFILFVLFFNDNSIIKSIGYNSVIDSLETEISISRDTFLYYQQLNNSLTSDPQTMERVARERYHMNRINEDVYVFE